MDERQFSYLQEMGIPLWVSRDVREIEQIQDVSEPRGENLTPAKSDQPLPSNAPLDAGEQAETPLPVPERAPETQHNVDAVVDESSLDWHALQGAVSQCQRCPELASQRTRTVFGVGNPQADWLIIGEAPGSEEDRRGEPFVGRAGQLLDAMLYAIGLKRSQVYIANILKCRPPNNRDPNLKEIKACSGYLQRQIALIQPKLILVVGRIAAQTLLKSDAPVGKLRGKVHQLELPESKVPLVVTYHPAYLLRAPAEKAKAWSDLKLAYNVFNR